MDESARKGGGNFAKIPVILLTGFLGAGKTTLLNRLLSANNGEKIAVIVNEFGEIGIDERLIVRTNEEVIELANGSICCALKSDTVQVLEKLLQASESGEPFQRVIIETTGLANPTSIIRAFFDRPMLATRFALDSVVTVVDSAHILAQLENTPEARTQIAVADIILLNKTDLVDASELTRLMEVIRGINKSAKIITTHESGVDARTIFSHDPFERMENAILDAHHHNHDDGIHSIALTENAPLDLDKVARFIGEHILLNGEKLLRYKGILQIKGMPERFVFQGVHMHFENRKDRLWGESETRTSEVVIIGKDLPELELREAFKNCVA